MKLNVLLSPVNADELFFTGKTTVVIDVLRASTTIITALANLAKEVIPVATVEFAVKVSGGMFGGHTLLGGERNTKKIEGFALGNSPAEYSKEAVEGKTIVYYTTNGTKAITKAKFSTNLFICSFINLAAVAKHLAKLNENIEIMCAGNNNLFSLEDSVCAGKLVENIIKTAPEYHLSDSAKSTLALNKEFGDDIFKLLNDCEHGRKLKENGFEEDLEFCSKLNLTDIIPFYKNNVLKALA